MKMLKKLLAIVLTGAMALTLLTACGGNAVSSNAASDKDIADALNDIAKVEDADVTFTPWAEEQKLAKAIAALYDSKQANTDAVPTDDEINKILGIDEYGANKTSRFVWCELALTGGIGAAGQGYQLADTLLGDARNNSSFSSNQKPADARHMGSALCKVTFYGQTVTMRVVVVTAEIKD